jgi:alginate O-acetyltransferase complex protein AlgI
MIYADALPAPRTACVAWEDFCEGICRFVTGFGKVTLLAHPLKRAADYAFRMLALSESSVGVIQTPAALAWIGIAAYGLQLLHGFSGLSDMACGLSRVFGFASVENFNYPYAARSVTDFHRRWYISLSDWLRVFLGLNICGEEEGARAMWGCLFAMLLTGLWYGASATFLVWALWHFLWIMTERVTRFEHRYVPTPLRSVYVLFTVGIGWIFFRAPDIGAAFAYLRVVLGLARNAFLGDEALMLLLEYWPFFAAGLFFAAPFASRLRALLPGCVAGARPAAVLRTIALMLVFAMGFLCVVREGGVIWV